MKKINALIILMIIIIATCAGILIYNQISNAEVKYVPLQVSGNCILSVPESNDIVQNGVNGLGLYIYKDKKYNLNITAMNLDENSLDKALAFNDVKNDVLMNSMQMKDKPKGFYYNSVEKVYTIGWYHGTQYVLISSDNLEILVHIYNTVKYPNDNADSSNSSNTAINNDIKVDSNSNSNSHSDSSHDYDYPQYWEEEEYDYGSSEESEDTYSN